MPQILTFETTRLFLKPALTEDADFILELFNTPKWLSFIGDRNVKSRADAEQYIQTKMLPQIEKLGFGNYIVIRKEDHEKIGTCGLYDREGLDGIDIGFAFLPQYEGKGYAYEAALRVKSAAFYTFDLKKINAIATKDNIPSQRLLEKLGLKFVKIIALNDEELMFYELEKPKIVED
jgi:[ribosomal protein S5]-alanine N-acetyltransferase